MDWLPNTVLCFRWYNECGLLLLSSFLVKHFPAFESRDVVRNFSPQKPDENLWRPGQIVVRGQVQGLQLQGAKGDSGDGESYHLSQLQQSTDFLKTTAGQGLCFGVFLFA